MISSTRNFFVKTHALLGSIDINRLRVRARVFDSGRERVYGRCSVETKNRKKTQNNCLGAR